MGGRSSPMPMPEKPDPYDDTWIHNRFSDASRQYDEVANWMNQRKTALATPQFYDVGGGMSVKQDQLGQYFQGQLSDQKKTFDAQLAEMQKAQQASQKKQGSLYDARLSDITAATGANRSSLQAQGEQLARAGERGRARSYSGTGGGFNRTGLRIQGLNV